MAATAPRSEKSVIGGLILFGLLSIVLGTMNLKRAIGPRASVAPGAGPHIPRTREELEAQQRSALAGLDTDADGLSDLDELERTRTSPFLMDSDGDGRSDQVETDAGEDPNCPTGKVCGFEPPAAAPLGGLEIPGAPSAAPPSAAPESGGELSVGELRRSLERQGVSPQVLQQLSDAQLLASYRQSLRTFTTLPTGGTSPIAGALSKAFTSALREGRGDVVGTLDALPSDPMAIRELLLRGGFPREQLQELDDATLLAAWEQVMSDLKQQQDGVLQGAP